MAKRPGRDGGLVDPEKIRELVAELFVRKPSEKRLQVLRQTGSAAVPALVAGLNDPEFRQYLDEPRTLGLVLELLEPYGPPDAAAPLAALIRHNNPAIRKEAALALGNIGTEECFEPLAVAISDVDEHVRSYALFGLRRGMKAGRSARPLLDRIFEPVARLLRDPDSFTVVNEAALALVEIDRERGTDAILEEHVLSRSTPSVYKVIEAAVQKQIAIPAERLLALLAEIRADVLTYPNYYTYGEALHALAAIGDERAPQLIREAMTWDNMVLAQRAAEALALSSGVSDPLASVVRRYNQGGLAVLTLPQRHYFCAAVFRGEVANGGLDQYFSNSWGDDSRRALEGLEAIGAPFAASILRRAMAVFGPDGPHTDRDVRLEQLAALSDEQDRALEALTTELFRDQDPVAIRLLEYARQHPADFAVA
jgi:HEAT repeat protein